MGGNRKLTALMVPRKCPLVLLIKMGWGQDKSVEMMTVR
jgi:hypothetical protein